MSISLLNNLDRMIMEWTMDDGNDPDYSAKKCGMSRKDRDYSANWYACRRFATFGLNNSIYFLSLICFIGYSAVVFVFVVLQM